ISSPLAQGSLRQFVARADEALKRDLAVRRYGQTRLRHVEDLYRFSNDSTCCLDLTFPIWDFETSQHEHSRMHPENDSHRAGQAAFVILTHDDAPVLTGRHENSCHVWALRLNAVTSVVDPARVWILH